MLTKKKGARQPEDDTAGVVDVSVLWEWHTTIRRSESHLLHIRHELSSHQSSTFMLKQTSLKSKPTK